MTFPLLRYAIPRVAFANPTPVFDVAVKLPKSVAFPVDEKTKVSISLSAGSPPKWNPLVELENAFASCSDARRLPKSCALPKVAIVI